MEHDRPMAVHHDRNTDFYTTSIKMTVTYLNPQMDIGTYRCNVRDKYKRKGSAELQLNRIIGKFVVFNT